MKCKCSLFDLLIISVAYHERGLYLQSCCSSILPNEKQVVYKRWTRIQRYAQTNFLKMTANKKRVISSFFSSGFREILLRSDVDLSRQVENDNVE